MGTVNVTLGEDARLNLILGQQLENAVTSVVFDFSAWQTAYGSGTLALSVQRPGDDQPYAVTMTTSGTDATWNVTNLDTAYKGVGHIQLTYTVGSAVKKSVVYKFTVYESLGANGEYPSPGQTWQEEIEDELADVKQDLDVIINNDTWASIPLTWELGSISSTNGSEVASTTRLRTGFIDITKYNEIRFTNIIGYKFVTNWFDANKALVKKFAYAAWRTVASVSYSELESSGVQYVRIVLANTSDTTISVSDAVGFKFDGIYQLKTDLTSLVADNVSDYNLNPLGYIRYPMSLLKLARGSINLSTGVLDVDGYRIYSDFIQPNNDLYVYCKDLQFNILRYDTSQTYVDALGWKNAGASLVISYNANYLYRIILDVSGLPNNSTSPSITDVYNSNLFVGIKMFDYDEYETIANKVLDLYQSKTVNISAGATTGKWTDIIGQSNIPIVVKCEPNNVITSYRVWVNSSSYITCEIGKTYYFDSVRGGGFDVQIPLTSMITSEGVVVGGDIVFTYKLQKDVLYLPNTLNGDVLMDNSINYSKLTNSTIMQLYEDAQSVVISEDYVQTNINTVCNELDDIQTENTSSIMFMTDLHLKAFDSNVEKTFSVIQRAEKAIEKIKETNMIDFNVLGGDYLWNNTSSTKAMAETAYAFLQKTFYPLRNEMFALYGNHDDNSIALSGTGLSAVIFPNETYRYIGKQYERSGTKYNPMNHNFYGYYDIPSQKIRVIFVNTVDIPYEISGGTLVYNGQHMTAISQTQSEFIQNALKFDESGWAVLFMAHHGLCNSSLYETSEDYTDNLWNIIKAYKNKTSYSGTVTNPVGSYSVSVDYTNNSSDEIIAVISGHNHADRSAVVDGILNVTTGTACASQATEVGGTDVSPIYESTTETVFDIYTVDRANEKLYATRYGLGNSRSWNY